MDVESANDSPCSVQSNAGRLIAECPTDTQQGHASPLSLYRLADRCRVAGDVTGWRRAIEVAFACAHESPEQLYYRARAKLVLGDWSGWTDYEARYSGPLFVSQHTALARAVRWSCAPWDGKESLTGKTLLVLNEQGFGDAIQMLRFLPTLLGKASVVALTVESPLQSLVDYNFGRVVTMAIDDAQTQDTIDGHAYDRYAWTMSLPALIGTLPPFTPLSAPVSPADQCPRRSRPLMAGICWAGSSHHPRDGERSMPIEALASLLTRRDIKWYSLQVGDRAAQADMYPALCQPPVVLNTFADTASLIACLDFVVTVDTAVAHLAGSMGIPTYVLLPIAATWRWGLATRTPWYPSTRLVRQAHHRDWASVVGMLESHLDSWLTTDLRAAMATGR